MISDPPPCDLLREKYDPLTIDQDAQILRAISVHTRPKITQTSTCAANISPRMKPAHVKYAPNRIFRKGCERTNFTIAVAPDHLLAAAISLYVT